MKKSVLLFLINIILFINLISAAYDCSGTLSTEESIINIGEIEVINGVRIALIDSSMGGAAEILIEVKELTLTSGSPYGNVTLASGFYEINLTGTTGSSAWMKIDGTEGNVEEKQVNGIGDLQFYVSSLSGTYSGGDANVEFFVADEYLFLYGANPAAIRTIGSKECLFEVSSSDSSRAIIKVQKCDGGKFTEISDSPEQEPDSDDSDTNDSLLQNDSLINNATENHTDGGLQKKGFLRNIIYIIILIIIVIIFVFIVLVIRYRVSKKNKKLK